MIRVLLVEDDAMIREMTRIFLESQKRFEVVCAASGEEALAHAKDPFDVILLDILLPDTNGMQLCQTLRSGKTNTIGVIVSDISNKFFADIARCIENHAYKHSGNHIRQRF